jgi:uncharacterized membrane protein SirB2
MQTFYLVLKTLHIYAFIAAIGVTLASLLAYRKFWHVYDKDRTQGLSAFPIVEALQVAGMIGMGVLLLAGIGMLAIAHWSFVQLSWFQIKLALIVLLYVNGSTIGRTSAAKLKGLMESAQLPSENSEAEVAAVRSRVRLFFSIQLALFAAIVLLSVFRFN